MRVCACVCVIVRACVCESVCVCGVYTCGEYTYQRNATTSTLINVLIKGGVII